MLNAIIFGTQNHIYKTFNYLTHRNVGLPTYPNSSSHLMWKACGLVIWNSHWIIPTKFQLNYVPLPNPQKSQWRLNFEWLICSWWADVSVLHTPLRKLISFGSGSVWHMLGPNGYVLVILASLQATVSSSNCIRFN